MLELAEGREGMHGVGGERDHLGCRSRKGLQKQEKELEGEWNTKQEIERARFVDCASPVTVPKATKNRLV